MIYSGGNKKATKAQKELIRRIADDSFSCRIPDEFGDVPATGYDVLHYTGTALAMKNCEPHTDFYDGDENAVDARRALFWVIALPRHAEMHIHVGNAYKRLYEGDYVVFDDSLMHSVQSDRLWRGVAYQLGNAS
jgi:hypothetical protein